MANLTSSLIVRLIDQVTGPARGVEESLRRINRAGGTQGAAPSFADRMAASQARVGAAIAANNVALGQARMGIVDAVAGYYILDRTIGRTIRVAAGFQEAMNGVAVVARATPDQLERLNAQARDLGRTTMFTASQVAEGMGFLAMAGFNAEQVMGAMPQTLALAAAGNMDLGRSADIVSNILTGYALQVSDLSRVSDILTGTFTRTNTNLEQLGTAFTYAGPIAAAAGMRFEETAAVLGRMGDAGFQGSMGGTALRGAIVRLLAPTRGAERAMADLSVSVADVVGDGEDLDDALAASRAAIERIGLQVTDAEGRMLPFVDIMRQLESHAEDAGLMTALFGQRAGPAMTALLRQGSQSVANLTEELSGLDGETQRVADVRMAGFNGQMRAFRSAVEGVQIAIGTALLPVLTDMVRGLTDMMVPVTAFIEANPGLTKAIIGTAAALIGLRIAAAGLTFIGLLGKGGALYMLAGGLRAITALGTPIAGFFATLSLRSMLAARATGRMPGILARIGDAALLLGRSVPGVKALGTGAAIAAAAFGLPAWAGLGVIATAVGAIAAGGVLIWKYWDRLTAVFQGVGEGIMEGLRPALADLQPLVEAASPLVRGLGDAFRWVADSVGSLVGWIGQLFEREILTDDQAAEWKSWGQGFGEWIGWGLGEALRGVIRLVTFSWVEDLTRPFMDLIEWLTGLGARMLEAIGIIDVGGAIRWPDPPAWVRRLMGGDDLAPAAAPADVGAGATGDAGLALDTAREVARLRRQTAMSAGGPVSPGEVAALAEELAEVEADLAAIAAGMPAAAQEALAGFVAALTTGGAAAEAEAERLGQQIVESLSVTATPVVDTSSLLAALGVAERVNNALDRLGAPRSLRFSASGAPPSGHRATGGPVWPGGSFLVGEREPEMFSPRSSGRITPLGEIERGLADLMSGARASGQERAGASGGTVNVSVGDIIVSGVSDPAEAARQVRDMITRELDVALRGINADMGVRV